MIVPMMKYSFVLYHEDYEGFLQKLQELGLVDITIEDWEATEQEYHMLGMIDKHRCAMSDLEALAKTHGGTLAEPFETPEETLEAYIETSDEITKIKASIAKLEKEVEEVKPLGVFSTKKLRQLRDEEGIDVRLFHTYTKDFRVSRAKWSEDYIIEEVAESDGVIYFAVISTPDSGPVMLEAVEMKIPEADYKEKERHIQRLEEKLVDLDEVMHRAAAGLDPLREYGARLKEQLHISQVCSTARRDADNTVVLLEGWATKETAEKVDALIDDYPVVSFKDTPTQEDNPPVVLKNNSFASLFEIIGSLYALPRYGTMDMTGLYAPFFMLFFGFCMGDMGYGLLFVVAALLLYKKIQPAMRPLLRLVMLCGGSAMVFGFLTGNFFGIAIGDWTMFEGLRDHFLTTDMLFPISLGIGVVHLYYAMTIKIVQITRLQGFKYALGTLGWMIALGSVLAAVLLPSFGVEGYVMGSVPFWIVTGIGLFLMLFLHNPEKNPLLNFGPGLWNTYNDITGFVGDVLSYLRLFALCLSGGILALVFNRLAVEMSPDIIIVKQLVMIIILAVGQGLNLFMTTLSAFVHPLRLTFVEFYKNAGFEAGGRAFNPLKKH